MGVQPHIDHHFVAIRLDGRYPDTSCGDFKGTLGMIEDIVDDVFNLLEIDTIAEFHLHVQPPVARAADVDDHFIRKLAVGDHYLAVVIGFYHRIKDLDSFNSPLLPLCYDVIPHMKRFEDQYQDAAREVL
ncbi:hypothetical protein D3C87_1734990 [compost metagenome]